MADIGKLLNTEIVVEMKKAYLDYAMSVIVSRALPDVKDGLKPVHRRILFAMHELGLTHSAKYRKSATVVGEVLGKYHPHGDVPVYDALVRLAQDFAMRYPLIDGQGNFGCFTKDTKVKLTDGRSLTFEQLIEEQAKGKKHWTFAFNTKDNKIEVTEITNPRLTHKNSELIEVTLDNDAKIRCTPDHRFLLRNSTYKEARDLKPNESLMPIYMDQFDGITDKNLKDYDRILQPFNASWEFIHHLSDQWNLEMNIYEKSRGRVRHHKDINKHNNNPDNITRLGWKEHWELHYKLASERHKNDPEYVRKISEGRRKFLEENHDLLSKRMSERNKKMWKDPLYREIHINRIKALWQDDEYRKVMTKNSGQNLKRLWNTKKFQELMSSQKSIEMKNRWKNPEYRKEMQSLISKMSIDLWSHEEHRKNVSEKMKKLSQDKDWRDRQSQITKKLWQDNDYRSKFSNGHFSEMAKILWSKVETLDFHKEKAKKQWEDSSFREKIINSISISNKKRLANDPNMMKNMATEGIKGRILSYVSRLSTSHSTITPELYEIERKGNVPSLQTALKYFESFPELKTKAQTYNHKVKTIRLLSEREDTYDLTTEPWHNFALDAGVFVHNSIDGDPPAAMRYTEARMAGIASEMLMDLDKETVTFSPNFDGSYKEPEYLPAKLPNLLLMGAEGIAVGMATKIPPHNLGEIIDAILFIIDKATFTSSEKSPAKLTSDSTVDELLEFIKGPDFPTAGSIYDIAEIRNIYATGRGKVMIRGKAEIEEIGNGKSAIIITELPYQVNKALLVARIADLAKEKKIEGITDLRDESDRHGIRVVIELKRDASPKKILNNLYKHTNLQTIFPANIVALVDGTPQTLNLKTILEEYLHHRLNVITRRSEFELRQAKARQHILDGLKIAVDHIDAVIRTIRESANQEIAKQNLITQFKLTDIQATAILDMQLRRLAALERQKIEDELQILKEMIEYLEDLLAHPKKILAVIKEELVKLKEKYADPRRTKVYKSKVGEFSEEDLIPNEPTVITITDTGYIKRQNLTSFRLQQRGGKGIKGMTTKSEDSIAYIRYAETHDNILFFTNKGKAYQLRAYEINESSRTSKGTAIVNLLNIESGEKIQSFISYRANVKATADEPKKKYIFLTTEKGTVKKSALTEFANIRRSGILAIKLEKSDELVWTEFTDGDQEVILTTHDGKAIRFSEKAVRPTGRSAMGVRGIRIGTNDKVIGMDVINKDEKLDLLTIMENGLGKKTAIDQFRGQSRGGLGVKVAKVTDKTGKVIFGQVIPPNSAELIITSKKGLVVKLAINSIPKLSRNTQGVILMRFSDPADRVTSATCIESEKE